MTPAPSPSTAASFDAQAAAPVLETRGLRRSFRGFTAVDGVDLAVAEGSIHAIIGPNGAGKTTLFNLLTKFLEPDAGAILYRGRDITRLKPAEIARAGVVRSFQISATFPHMTLLENVRIGLQRRRPGSFRFWVPEASLDGLNDRAVELLDQVGLAADRHRLAADLPYGRKRALEIATTLALEPDLILLDEPTQGMGHEDVGRVKALIRRVAKGRTVVMVEHNMGVVADLCDRITVLQRGRTLSEGAYAEVSKDPRVVEAYLGQVH